MAVCRNILVRIIHILGGRRRSVSYPPCQTSVSYPHVIPRVIPPCHTPRVILFCCNLLLFAAFLCRPVSYPCGIPPWHTPVSYPCVIPLSCGGGSCGGGRCLSTHGHMFSKRKRALPPSPNTHPVNPVTNSRLCENNLFSQ